MIYYCPCKNLIIYFKFFFLKVNKTIQLLAQQYCNECKISFEELSKIIQQVLISRKELISYDCKQNNLNLPTLSPFVSNNFINKENKGLKSKVLTNHCYGCSTAVAEHCLILLRALATQNTVCQLLCSKGVIQELLVNNLRRGSLKVRKNILFSQ